jgi:SNF2 family DNA or RNA helicase
MNEYLKAIEYALKKAPSADKRSLKNLLIKEKKKLKKESVSYLDENTLAIKPQTSIKSGFEKLYESGSDEIIQDSGCITESNFQLRQHQKVVVDHMKKARGLLAFHGIGTGKTFTAVTSIKCIKEMFPEIKVVFVSPTSLIDNLKKEFIAYGNFGANLKEISFYSYEEFSNAWYNKKIDCENTFLIIDEAHNLKTEVTAKKGQSRIGDKGINIGKGKRSFAAIQCASKAKKVLLLSATPMVNDPSEIINLIAMVDGVYNVLLTSGDSTERYFNKNIKPNDENLKKYLRCKFSYFKTEIDENYPNVSIKEIRLPMLGKAMKIYYQIIDQKINKELEEFLEEDKNLKVFYNGLRRAVNLKLGGKNPKIDWINEHFTKNPGRKTVIFSQFLKTGINLVKKLMTLKKISFVEITGEVSRRNRNERVKRFNDPNSNVNVFLLSAAGGEGLDLKEVRDVIIMEPTWNEAKLNQAIGRAVRYKSHARLPINERNVTVYKLFLSIPQRIKVNNGIRVKPSKYREFAEMYLYELTSEELLEIFSVDEILDLMSALKQKEIDSFVERIIPFSIENQSC